MAGGSSDLGLLFEISADPSAATAAVDTSASEITAALSRMQDSAGEASDAVAEGAREMRRAHEEAREAVRGTGELIGVTMPRYVANYLSSLGGVQEAMAGAFSAIAVLGLIDIYGRLSDKVGGLEADMARFSEASVKAWSETRSAIIAGENELLVYDQKLREIGQIGLGGSTEVAEKQRENAEAIKETQAALDTETAAMEEAQRKVDSFGTGIGNLFRSTEQYKRELGNATDALKQHGDQVHKLENDILDLQLAQLRLNREMGSEKASEQEKADKDQQERDKRAADVRLEMEKTTDRLIEEVARGFEENMKAIRASGLAEIEQRDQHLNDSIKSYIELLQLGAEFDKRFADQVVGDYKEILEWERGHIKTMQEEQKEAGDLSKKEHDYMTETTEQYGQQAQMARTLASALSSIGEIYGKNAALRVAALAAEAAVEVAMNTAAAFAALGDQDYWAAANYFAAAAEYGIAAGAQASGAGGGGGGGGGGGTRTGGNGGEVGSGASAAGQPQLAPGSRPTGVPSPGSIFVVGGDQAYAVIAAGMNQAIRTQGVMVQATHDGQGNRIGS